jgi:hypothetical protein
VLQTSALSPSGSSWVSAESAVIVLESVPVRETEAGDTEPNSSIGELTLEAILVAENLPVVPLPATLLKALVQQRIVRAEAGPAFVRDHFRSRLEHPSLLGVGHLGMAKAAARALFLLQVATSDLEISKVKVVTRDHESSVQDSGLPSLCGLELLPLKNGSFGVLDTRDDSTESQLYFLLGNMSEMILLEGIPGFVINIPHKVEGVCKEALDELRDIVYQLARTAQYNVALLEPTFLADLLLQILPDDWAPISTTLSDSSVASGEVVLSPIYSLQLLFV